MTTALLQCAGCQSMDVRSAHRAPREQLLAQFMAKVSPEPNSGCWLWLGNTTGGGRYGFFRGQQGPLTLAHRASWLLFRGTILNGEGVLHRCDVTFCVNPDHLFLGSHAENMADMVKKGRHAHGETAGAAKLTESEVLEIKTRRARGETIVSLGREFGVHNSHISRIANNKKWRHLADRSPGGGGSPGGAR